MTTTIALAGKGGTGKTSIAALLIRVLIERRAGSILAIDADPASNLHLALGLPLGRTVGDIREETLQTAPGGTLSTGVARQDWLDHAVRMALEEGDEVDLLAMGRPEGPGCYCAVNHMLRQIIDALGRAYDYVVIDNEAGMEHLSRRTTRDVDILLLVSDPTLRGILAASQMARLAERLHIHIERTYLLLNRVADPLPQPLQQAITETGLELAGVVPFDPILAEFDGSGRPIAELPAISAAYQAVYNLAERLLGLHVPAARQCG
ncbi:MAG: AAA family ATPase [Anaerolineae bacterium]|nr:AAA family ATPase [Anaerolineae bacterium]MDW8099399.1 AAA family ATPase [Anaerolineae bacterium]